MKAIVHEGVSGIKGLRLREINDTSPGPGEVKIRIRAAGLNHRDLFLMDSRSQTDEPLIIGSDGAGVVDAVGEGVTELATGTEVIINPSLNWPITDEVPRHLAIVGGPSPGTFAEYITVPAHNALPKPRYLSWEEAGGLPLSALTAYRLLFTKGGLQSGQHVFIPGIGGGVATYAMMMARAAGATVTVSSRSEYKRNKALQHGAHYAVDSAGDWSAAWNGDRADLILDSIGPATFHKYWDIVKPNGRIVVFGASSGDHLTIPMRALFFPQINVLGSSMGSSEEFRAMLQFMESHQLRPIVDSTFPLQEAARAVARMQLGEQYGNIVLTVNE
ncbi:zinc-binding dehydrogenase [Paenibacillus sp. J5C_2022]|uniref:zinc-binding dehydrogenase n=1 Tax=Paenibacillus sp. J5C2022 TaxID=2977129 RepID=UPI0021CF548E|nr:zinc-binding dehydrogenase [Paenibacillus sp. J5C2022]MCU6708637.1 zinc-binding dehydrogenase [Paenibacillus sp. J5C2022]